jgi:hypothetical protein
MNPRRVGRSMCCRGRWLGTLLILAVAAPAASGQVIQIQGGSSSLLNAYGGSFELHAGDSTGRFDLGFLGRPELGFSFTKPYHGWNYTVGDRIIPFVLPTDQFSRSSYFLGRGLSLEKREGGDRMLFYVGTTSLGFRTPYVNLARSQDAVELVFYEHQISPRSRFYSYNILSSRQTSLQGFEWMPRKGLKLATTAGIGSNQSYWAGSLDFERDWVSIQGGYTRSGDSFQRVDVKAPLVAETRGPNLRVQLRPRSWMALTASHQNYLNPIPGSSYGRSAAVDSLGASAIAAGFRFNGSVFHSRTQVSNLHSFNLGAQRSLGGRVEVGESYFQSRAGSSVWRSLSTRVREQLTRRFSLSQTIMQSNGRASLELGGNFVSNRFSIGLDHQTFFYPFAGRSQSPFRQALMVNVQFQLPHNTQFHAATAVDAFGRLRYTSYADSYFYPHGSEDNGGGRFRRLPDYVVRGIVVDDHQQPIRGAALRIGGQMVFTDSQGSFLLRVAKPKEYSLQVLLDQFMFPGQYEVLSAPAELHGGKEELANPCEIVLRRTVTTQTAVSSTGNSAPKPTTR